MNNGYIAGAYERCEAARLPRLVALHRLNEFNPLYPSFGNGGKWRNFTRLPLIYAHFIEAVRLNDIHIYIDR